MKVVVQTGNTISRRHIDTFLAAIPERLIRNVGYIVVFFSLEDDLRVDYGGGCFGVHCPESFEGTSKEVLAEMAVSLMAMADFGHIPDRMSSSRRDSYLQEWTDFRTSV